MQDRHVDVKGSKLRFRFRGKSGRQHEVDVTDRRIARIVSKLQDLPGQSLFQYVDDEENVRDITSQDVNEYLREITGEDFTAKDFRTWAGTVLAGSRSVPPESSKQRNRPRPISKTRLEPSRRSSATRRLFAGNVIFIRSFSRLI